MGKPFLPEEALLFTGALYREEKYFSIAKQKLVAQFGEMNMESGPMQWDYSDYYREELGTPILRKFIFFRDRINPETLCDIKLATNDMERQLSEEGRRNINLDPGYLTPSKVVLASTKNYSHRIYLGKGIYAEVTLVYRDGRYCPYLFTYRDYASDAYAEIFAAARKIIHSA